jgi:queuine tRNA-ribosyltransferase
MFTVTHSSGMARAGILKTAHGSLATPFFMPVATKGTVKFLDFTELEQIGINCVISNSLLLSQKPGVEIIRKAGGLHKFYGWRNGIFTDSGGFQSLDGFFLQKSTPDGLYFKSPYDGTTGLITPEKAMDIQIGLGSDVAMCLDDVPRPDDTPQAVRSKTLRTHSWAKRCRTYHTKHQSSQLLFGIAQGGSDPELRRKSIAYISGLGFDGLALGGLAIGEPAEVMRQVIKTSVPLMPQDKPRYLMGVGSPEDLLECIGLGIDCFDSTFPTQNARHSTLFTWSGKLRIDRKEFADDTRAIDEKCGCMVCRNFSRAYLQHLQKANEATGKKLATYHNLTFVQELISSARLAIQQGRYVRFMTETLSGFG